MTRFVHTADWQLGMTRHFLDVEAQARFTAARLEAVAAIGELAVAQRCPSVVVCGDVFESNHVERQVVVRALDAMAATPEVTFHLLPGNHDPLDAASVLRSATFTDRRPANVVVLDSTEPVRLGDGAELVAAPWTTKRPLTDLVAQALGQVRADGTVRVAVGHGAVDAIDPDPANPAQIRMADLEAALDQGRVHYVALGDRHSTTDVGRTGRIRYPGTPEPTAFDEVDPGNVLVVDVDGDRVAVDVHRVGRWRFHRQRMDLGGAVDVERVAAWLAGLEDKPRAIVKLALVGQLGLADKVRLDDVLAHHGDLLAALDAWERRSDLVVLPDDRDLDDLQLSGFARQALEDLRRTAAGQGPDAVVARDALGLLYRLGSGAR